ncbi:MAG: hypothetical protein Q9202_002001 [Teloschistes flavicans]
MTTDPRFALNPCILKNADKDQHLANFYELAEQVINIQYACGRADEAWYAKGSEVIHVEFEKLARKMEGWEDNMDHFRSEVHLKTPGRGLDTDGSPESGFGGFAGEGSQKGYQVYFGLL